MYLHISTKPCICDMYANCPPGHAYVNVSPTRTDPITYLRERTIYNIVIICMHVIWFRYYICMDIYLAYHTYYMHGCGCLWDIIYLFWLSQTFSLHWSNSRKMNINKSKTTWLFPIFFLIIFWDDLTSRPVWLLMSNISL